MTLTTTPPPALLQTGQQLPPPTRGRRSRKLVRHIGIAPLALVVVVMTGTVTTSVLDQVERQTVPTYGTRVQVTGGAVNVYRHGDRGPTIVMLSGYNSAAPALDFAPLIRQLGNVSVVVVEGLGYGYSDTSGSPRTIENITADLHEAVTAMHINKPYILLGHSIAGIYNLYYANRYRAEISAVIGIDASVPGQVNGLTGQGNPVNRLWPPPACSGSRARSSHP
jgi:pimeloyl-ACP methyl ester carboxylesterase